MRFWWERFEELGGWSRLSVQTSLAAANWRMSDISCKTREAIGGKQECHHRLNEKGREACSYCVFISNMFCWFEKNIHLQLMVYCLCIFAFILFFPSFFSPFSFC